MADAGRDDVDIVAAGGEAGGQAFGEARRPVHIGGEGVCGHDDRQGAALVRGFGGFGGRGGSHGIGGCLSLRRDGQMCRRTPTLPEAIPRARSLARHLRPQWAMESTGPSPARGDRAAAPCRYDRRTDSVVSSGDASEE
ncbi:hypothetical protein GCM10022382_29590 [Microbacterium invictum]